MSDQISFPTTGVSVKREALLLGIDDQSLPLRENLCLYLSKPTVRREPILAPRRDNPNAPDHIGVHFYGTVLYEDGRFRMWYYPISQSPTAPGHRQGPVCYAESGDGIEWGRPVLGQVELNGNRENNAISLPDEQIEGVSLIKDEEDPDPQRRYKMVYNPHSGKTYTIRCATSPDGLHWTAGEYPDEAKFLEHASFFRHNGLYVVHGQAADPSEGGGACGRQGYAWVSPDFDHWLPEIAPAFLLPEPADPNDRGHTKPYDQVHLGVGAASFGNVAVGLYGRWHNCPGREDPNVVDSWFGHGRTSCDLGLVISNDGIHFREPVKGHVYLSREDSPVTEIQGKPYPTILIQTNSYVNVGDETRLYHGRWRNAEWGDDYWAEAALATIPRDRWGALGLCPDKTTGSLWTAPITLPTEARGISLTLNAEAANGMRVAVADERFSPIAEFAGEQAGSVSAEGGLDCVVEWPKANLTDLAGKTVRLRVVVQKTNEVTPKLYAMNLRTT